MGSANSINPIMGCQFPQQYKSIKCDNHSILEHTFLIQHTITNQCFTLKNYQISIEEPKGANRISKQNKLLCSLFNAKNRNYLDLVNILNSKQQIVNIKDIFEYQPEKLIGNYSFMKHCTENSNLHIGIVLDCLQSDLEAYQFQRQSPQMTTSQVINIMNCVLEGIKYLQFYNIGVFPICKKTIFVGAHDNGLDISREIIKVMPASLVQGNFLEIIFKQFHIPPQLEGQLSPNSPYHKYHNFTIQQHIYCLGATILDLLVSRKFSIHNQSEISIKNFLQTQNSKETRFQAQQLQNVEICDNIKFLLKQMIAEDPQQRIKFTSLIEKLAEINSPRITQHNLPLQDISKLTNHQKKMSSVQLITSARLSNVINLPKAKKNKNSLNSIEIKRQPIQSKPPVSNRIFKHIDFTNGAVYEGQVTIKSPHQQNDHEKYKFNGLGTLFYPDGSICYTGNWSNNKFHGFGYLHNKLDECQAPDESRMRWKTFEGEFRDDKREGYGTVYYEKGQIFQGYFSNNVKSGKGTFYDKNGWPRVQVWDHGILQNSYHKEKGQNK